MADSATRPKQDFSRLYSDVADTIAATMDQINRLEIDHKNGKDEIGTMLQRLRAMQSRFDEELGMLEEHAEWEKFTIAFFGETNAGKSTIIESLRILFEDQSRRLLLEQNANDLKGFENALASQVDSVRQGLLEAHAAYSNEVAGLRSAFENSSRVLLENSASHAADISRKLRQLATELQTRATGIEKLASDLARLNAENSALQEEKAHVAGELDKEKIARARADETLMRTEAAGLAERSSFLQAMVKARRAAWVASVAGVLAGGLACGLILMSLK